MGMLLCGMLLILSLQTSPVPSALEHCLPIYLPQKSTLSTMLPEGNTQSTGFSPARWILLASLGSASGLASQFKEWTQKREQMR